MKVTKHILAYSLLTTSLLSINNAYAIACVAGADNYFCRNEAQEIIDTANDAKNTANAASSAAQNRKLRVK